MRESFPTETASKSPSSASSPAPKEKEPSEKKEPIEKKDPKKQARQRPYALDSQIEEASTYYHSEILLCQVHSIVYFDAEKIVQVSEKPMKKLFKGNDKAGEGGFGEVFVAKDLNSKGGKERVAVKRVPHDNPRVIENNWTEIAFLAFSKHPNIVDFKRAFLVKEDKKAPEEIWIVMEYLEVRCLPPLSACCAAFLISSFLSQGGTVSEAAAANALSEDHIAFVAHEILMALKFLHEKQWVHRDLKSANVMMSIKGEIKLIDFGLCADFSEGPRQAMLGSPYWIPPEMTWQHPHSYPADVWSMAVCLLELMLAHPPHNDSNLKCMFLVATKGLNDQIPSTATPAAKAFLQRCMILDPEKRPNVVELLKDPWVTRPKLNAGIEEVLRQVFLTASFQTLGF